MSNQNPSRTGQTVSNAGSGLGADQVNEIAASLRKPLADVFVLYIKTKNFHWHIPGSHFPDYHLLLDEKADQRFESDRGEGSLSRRSARYCYFQVWDEHSQTWAIPPSTKSSIPVM